MFNLHKNKGLTLIELLAVIAIIAILFVLLIPQIDNAVNKSRESGVMTDFRSYEIAASQMYRELQSTKTTADLNNYLDKELMMNSNKSKKKNPWGEYYYFAWLDKNGILLHTSNGDKTYKTVITFYNNEININRDGFGSDSNFIKKNEQGILYIDKGDSIILVGYEGDSNELIIPDSIDSKPIDSISDLAFSTEANIGMNHGSELSKVSIPGSVKKIGGSSFRYNSITELTLEEGIEHIQPSAFRNTKISSVTIPSTVTLIENYAFYTNPNLKTYKILGNPTLLSYTFPTTASRE